MVEAVRNGGGGGGGGEGNGQPMTYTMMQKQIVSEAFSARKCFWKIRVVLQKPTCASLEIGCEAQKFI